MKEYINRAYLENFELLELIAFSFYVMLIFLFSRWMVASRIKKNPEFRYYIPGLIAKLLAAIVFCFMYVYYYRGGDTIAYYESARAFANLFLERPEDFLKIYFTAPSKENFCFFSSDTGYPWTYMYYDTRTFWVIRIITPFLLLSFNSYLISTVLLSWASFLGIWRLFRLFYEKYPHLHKQLAIAVLFIPSTLFWGSGILKDTITLTCLCWFVYFFNASFFKRKNIVFNISGLFCMSFLVLAIKPYIVIALIPGTIVWISMERIRRIRNTLFRIAAIPVIYISFFTIGFGVLNALGSKMGRFSMDNILETAVVTQQDLKKEYYGGSRFDIGEFDASIGGVSQKIPTAVVAGLFRPFIWEARSIVVVLSGLENLFLLVMSIFILYKIKFKHVVKILLDNPILIFSLSYSIIFAFSLGLTTANFGALVRFKIAFLPFFASALFILKDAAGMKSWIRGRAPRFA